VHFETCYVLRITYYVLRITYYVLALELHPKWIVSR
jgi:hypothetical protein